MYVNLYAASRTELEVCGQTVRMDQRTKYPMDGRIELTVSEGTYELCLRIPQWADCFEARKNGAPISEKTVNDGFLRLNGPWHENDVEELCLEMKPRRIYANPHVSADAGKVAVQRGPIVYCAEAADNGVELWRLRLPRNAELREETRDDFTLGAVGVFAEGLRQEDQGEELYQLDAQPRLSRHDLHLIPYSLWANRGAGEMSVWLLES